MSKTKLEKMLLSLGYSKQDAKKTAKLSVIKGIKQGGKK